MLQSLVSWLFGLFEQFSLLGTWLTTDLPHIDLAPLELISYAGITFIIGFLIVRLVIGG